LIVSLSGFASSARKNRDADHNRLPKQLEPIARAGISLTLRLNMKESF
tara:strand:- start:9051 stop:9194 length:144 start_codon:yes stop_codon:yes gene_type:complete